ncbi:MAG: glycoside hydrolase family 5 protein [Ruminiclostridium sp.]|nr:glycoside hydrolase family 5 protein [Ruminiclostridium sp.]
MIDTIKNGCPHIKKTGSQKRKVPMKKRMLAAILSGIMVITGISACSGNAATSSENSSASTTTATTTTNTTKAETTAATTTTKAETTTTTVATTTTTTTATQNPEPAPAETKGDSVQFSQNLMPGWNLGNQLESNSDGTPSETAWGNPVITENLIKQVKAQGFKSIRIPVSYLSKIGAGPNYTIDSKWLDRVQEVVDMCINNGLYAIINIHGDGYYSVKGGWLLCGESASEQKTIKAKYEKVWEQIAKRFKNYDDHLVFESMNEEYDGTYNNPNPEYYNNINAYNQIFVDTVRKAGGKNNNRYLLIPGWNTDINFTTGDCDTYTMEAKFVIPNDSRIMISVHYYTPWEFCGEEGYDTFYKWGDSVKKFVKRRQSETLVNRQFDKLYNAFIKNGYGVVIGEYGSIDRTHKDKSNTTYRAYFAEYVNYAAHQRNIVTVYWDNGYNGKHGFGLFDRTKCTVTQPEIIKGIINGAKATKAPAAPTE